MRLTWRLLPLLYGLVLGLGLPAAAAQPVNTEVCQDDAECARLANQASEMSAMGLLGDAQRVYDAAYKRRADPKLLYERGRVLQKLGRYVDAAICYRKYLELDTSGNDKQHRKTEQYLDEALQQAQDTPPAPRQPEQVVAPPPVKSPTPAVAAAALTAPTAASAPAAVTAEPGAVAVAPQAAPVAPPKLASPVKVVAQTPIHTGPPPPKKVWQKWWFWTAIGAGAVVIGAGLGVGLGVASRQPDLTGVATFHPFGN